MVIPRTSVQNAAHAHRQTERASTAIHIHLEAVRVLLEVSEVRHELGVVHEATQLRIHGNASHQLRVLERPLDLRQRVARCIQGAMRVWMCGISGLSECGCKGSGMCARVYGKCIMCTAPQSYRPRHTSPFNTLGLAGVHATLETSAYSPNTTSSHSHTRTHETHIHGSTSTKKTPTCSHSHMYGRQHLSLPHIHEPTQYRDQHAPALSASLRPCCRA